MSSPSPLPGLTDREAIADALHRCILGIDSNDHALFASACLQDATMRVEAGGFTMTGWQEIDAFFARLFHLVTTHTVTNIRVNHQPGAETASMTAHAIS